MSQLVLVDDVVPQYDEGPLMLKGDGLMVTRDHFGPGDLDRASSANSHQSDEGNEETDE